MRKRLTILFAVLCFGVSIMIAKDYRTVVFKVEKMTCDNCEKKIRDNIRFEKGLKRIATGLQSKTVTITYDAEKTNITNLQKGFKKINYEAVVVEDKKDE
ncbi:MAG: heavy-metal-associated domain-containing protein [Mediterranea sp.]|nr:heavy-metal-associated domain-containing protein [Mediterranea sp.]